MMNCIWNNMKEPYNLRVLIKKIRTYSGILQLPACAINLCRNLYGSAVLSKKTTAAKHYSNQSLIYRPIFLTCFFYKQIYWNGVQGIPNPVQQQSLQHQQAISRQLTTHWNTNLKKWIYHVPKIEPTPRFHLNLS